ncbi:MAG: deoxyribose-phosphate aldolase [Clostridiales bacterium]|nr:deoxyribose-phosphate aldolase [Clostridiales bacterium]MDN5281031.1 deoxyribose-phosphate aldolase [Candidatus Ozemobacter sp.]
MEAIVEQIAREVMLKLKSESANRGSSYSPPPQAQAAHFSVARATNNTAVLVTANFKVVSQVIDQVRTLLPQNGKLIVSSYVYQNFGGESLGRSFNLVHAKNTQAQRALEGVDHLLIPSLSINSLAKAANLMADSFATIVLTQALIDGVKVTICDESIIDANRYFPAGVARKIEAFRRELESMGIAFQRVAELHVTPSHKCADCAAGNCASCTSCPTPSSAPAQTSSVSKPSAAKQDECSAESCSKSYGSCVTYCANKVKEVIEAGANRVDKGLDAPIPGHELARFIDHTLLKANATREEIVKLCEEARENNFASVCVNPANVALAAQLLRGCQVKVCTVIGFPLGASSTFVKAMETRDAVANGATEIDMVINVGALKSKDYELVKNDIARVVEAANGNTVKVILETSLLNDEEKVKACELSKLAGADFVKTSTGFSTGGATMEDVCLMRQVVGPNMGVKASGGIRDTETAQRMIQMGATRIGASASVAIVRNESDGGKGY